RTTDDGRREGYEIQVFGTEHGGGSVGYALREHERRGRFDVEKARAAGIPEGPLWGKLTKGEPITLPNGPTFQPSDFVGPKRPGRDRKSTRLNSSHGSISYAVFCLKKKKTKCKVETGC